MRPLINVNTNATASVTCSRTQINNSTSATARDRRPTWDAGMGRLGTYSTAARPYGRWRDGGDTAASDLAATLARGFPWIPSDTLNSPISRRNLVSRRCSDVSQAGLSLGNGIFLSNVDHG